MISYHEAQRHLEREAKQIQPILQKVSLEDALGQICACPIISPIHVPHFRNSAMDGYAICRSAIQNANLETPVSVPLGKTLLAGETYADPYPTPIALRIMTGAVVPEPFDAVVPLEDVCVGTSSVTFHRCVAHGQNIRFPGEDIQKGQEAMQVGECFTPEKIMLLSALGITHVEVTQKPRLHILSTGKEIVLTSQELLTTNCIYDTNTPFLTAQAKHLGLQAHWDHIDDRPEAFEAEVERIAAGSVVISTGAVSKGMADFVPKSLERLGATIHFHRVNIRPGKPILFATLPNGNPYFGLPGNPAATAVGFYFFVKPFLSLLQGERPTLPITAKLIQPFVKTGSFRHFLKATLNVEEGCICASLFEQQASFAIRPMAEGNAWVVIEEDRMLCDVGEQVEVYPYGPLTQ